MKTTYLLLLLSLLSGAAVRAQILNLEKTDYVKDSSTAFYLNAAFSSNLYNRTAAEDEPIDFFGLGGNFDMVYFSAQHMYTFLNKVDYLNINNSPFNSTGYTHMRVNFAHQRFFSYELFGQAQYDRLRLLDYRFLLGGGFRFRLLDTEHTHIFANLGVMYENERWNDPDEAGRERQVDFLKSANHVRLRTDIHDRFSINTVLYYQVGYDERASLFRHRVNTETNLLFEISNLLDFKVSFSAAYENKPIIPITRFIYALSNSIQFNLKRKKEKARPNSG